MAYADYTFYSATFLGTAIAQADFPRLAALASAKIDQLTFGRAAAVVAADTDAATIEKIELATCAVAEMIQSLEQAGGVVASERVGNVQVTYAATGSRESGRLRDAARTYLWNTDLMYRGFADGEA